MTNQRANEKSLSLFDLLFSLYIITSFLCERTVIGRACLLLFVVFGLLALISQKRSKGFYIFFGLDFFFLLYCLIQLNNGNVFDKTASKEMIETYFLCFLFGIAVYSYMISRTPWVRKIKLILSSFIFAITVNFILDIDKIFSGRFNFEGITLFGMRFGGAQAVSLGWIAGACLFFNLALKKTPHYSSLRYWTVFAYLSGSVILSGTRKALIFVAVAFFLSFNTFDGKRLSVRHLRNIIASVVLLGIGYLSIMNIPVLYNAIGYRIESAIGTFFFNDATDGSIDSRRALLSIAKDLFAQKPIWGWGLANFVSVAKTSLYSHNNYYELLVGVGLIGTLIYYSKYFYLLIKVFFSTKLLNSQKTIFLALLACILILEIWQIDYYTRKFLLFPIIILSLTARLEKEENNEHCICGTSIPHQSNSDCARSG